MEYTCSNCGFDRPVFEDQKLCLSCGSEIEDVESEEKREKREKSERFLSGVRGYMFRNIPISVFFIMLINGTTITLDAHTSREPTVIELPEIGILGLYAAMFFTLEPIITFSISKIFTALNIDLRGFFHGIFRSVKDKKI